MPRAMALAKRLSGLSAGNSCRKALSVSRARFAGLVATERTRDAASFRRTVRMSLTIFRSASPARSADVAMQFQNANLWGVCQLRKSHFVNIVNRDAVAAWRVFLALPSQLYSREALSLIACQSRTCPAVLRQDCFRSGCCR